MAIDKAAVSFNPEKDIPPLDGKVILVTGGNNGLGKQAICEYVKHKPKQVWLAARNVTAAQEVVDEIHQYQPESSVKVLQLDLTSFESVKKASQRFLAESDRLDILMLNAGIMAAAPGLTENGYEVQFGTNHMGHALLTKLLLPVLERTASEPGSDVRIVSLSSRGHFLAPKEGIVFDSLKTTADGMRAFERYGQSKLANVLFARQLAAQYPQFTVTAIHPGVVRTNLVNGMSGVSITQRALGPLANYFFTPVNQGAKNQLWASVAKDVKSGAYYEPVGVSGKASRFGRDEDLAKELWDWTVRELDGWSL
ncbi:short-chain dehydrogenase/reductase [Pochonia chlamydosporia 170]|uniref:Short-chain dehydrogenase/reductase n=1 Tax=Pochonia chlamydosporia 170 TaxID=1380566 RepID=A0A179FV69_METCM|nr:short-chain dehydrogenase/reductase [Pochonia chlamydosporia 170]OAQ69011.1 short-chain dehydrogenase/reductase [Pochonia chlamydosporia 170]